MKMNNVIRHLKLTSAGIPSFITRNLKLDGGSSRLYSTFWNAVKFPQRSLPSVLALRNTCNTSTRHYSAKNDQREIELDEFLDGEIEAEERIQKAKTIPSKIHDFNVTLDGTEVTLTKQAGVELIEVCFNVNDSIEDPNTSANEEQTEALSKPDFEVSIKRGDTTLLFSCCYTDKVAVGDTEGEYDVDEFIIRDIAIFKGTMDDKTYRANGDTLDGSLYDLLKSYLDQKGISEKFVIEMSEFASAYEHSSYISLLRELKKFAV